MDAPFHPPPPILPDVVGVSYPANDPACTVPPPPPAQLIGEFERILRNEEDVQVLENAFALLFKFSVHHDDPYSLEVCKALSVCPVILNSIFNVLRGPQFRIYHGLICFATGNLANISKYEEGRKAILKLFDQNLGVNLLIESLKSRDSNVVIFAITALHNLLLERSPELENTAKSQIKPGLANIVGLLGEEVNDILKQNYEFKVIVLDCLQILSYKSPENKEIINSHNGTYLILNTIYKNIKNTEFEIGELIETALRVLKSLSTCLQNKKAIINNNGIGILYECIKGDNTEVLKICLWTIRNLSDLLNDSWSPCLEPLAQRILQILTTSRLMSDPCIITCALGIFSNITCNNEKIKKLACEMQGIECLITIINTYKEDDRDFRIVDREILEPAVCALCHLTNLNHTILAEKARKIVTQNINLFKYLRGKIGISFELSTAIDKLLLFGNPCGEGFGCY